MAKYAMMLAMAEHRTRARLRAFVRLHPSWGDGKLGEAVGISRARVSQLRRKMGLPLSIRPTRPPVLCLRCGGVLPRRPGKTGQCKRCYVATFAPQCCPDCGKRLHKPRQARQRCWDCHIKALKGHVRSGI